MGFAAESEKLHEYAQTKLISKNCDMIVANDISEAGVLGGESNKVCIVTKEGMESLPMMSKTCVAEQLVARLAAMLGEMLGGTGL